MSRKIRNGIDGFSTRAIHVGYDPAEAEGALTPPIHLTPTYVFESAEHGAELFAGTRDGYIYGRTKNPTQTILEKRLANLEGGEAALAVASGIGSAELVQRIRLNGLRYLTGATLSPLSAFLILRGLKTLELRMAQHSRSAQAVAEMLTAHPSVAAVHYPGLPSFPQADIVRYQMSTGGGLVSFELKGGIDEGRALMNALTLAQRAVSLGDAETLVQHPASMTHAAYSAEERAQHGISDGLIRLSVGLENTEDILDDLDAGLNTLKREAGVARQTPV